MPAITSTELSNHLGKIMVTLNDPILPGDYQTSTPKPDNIANLMNAQDYYPFGMQMPGRSYLASGTLTYRYEFNGKGNDNEVKGVGDQQDYGMRVYDPRVGRFLSVDPLSHSYPWYTPYQFAGNCPIAAIDLDGLEEVHFFLTKDKEGKTHLNFISARNYNEHNIAGVHFTTSIEDRRYQVDYDGSTYYIGFKGAYGKGNETAVPVFEIWMKDPDAEIFTQMFFTESESYPIEGTRIMAEAIWNRCFMEN